MAVSPTHDGVGPWPDGPSALGADEAIAELMRALESSDSGAQRLTFLIGGPGNGKSALARRATAGLEMIGSPDPNLAHRSYTFRAPHDRYLYVINDATIPDDSSDAPHGALLRDIQNALGSGHFLLANINRGVLYDELSNIRSLSSGTFGGEGTALEVLDWVSDIAQTLGDDTDGGFNPVRTKIWHSESSETAELIAQVVLMDVSSLLEERPEITIAPDGSAKMSSPYKVARLTERAELGYHRVPASLLLREFLNRLDPELSEAPDHDPVRANIESLKNESVRVGFLTLLRAAELASSRRFSYRELWGAYVRAVVGWLPDRTLPEEGRTYLAKGGKFEEGTPLERFEFMAHLAGLRMHQSIVGATPLGSTTNSVARSHSKNPVLRLTALIDPTLDATPQWCEPVTEALAFPAEHQSPLRTLLNDPRAHQMTQAITQFDHLLDAAYVASLDVASDTQRRRIDSWYGGYLIRLLALSTARPAFLMELDQWTRAWQVSSWPTDLKKALRTLIFPTRAGGTTMLLPILEGRAHPIIEEPEAPRLVRVIESHDTTFKKVRRGESLFVTISAGNGRSAELELDFDLLREALACNDGHLGLSDRARATLPRLERFRANLLRPELDLGYAILSHGDEVALEVEER